MIVKKIPNPKKSKHKVERVTSLIEYISNPGEENVSEKCVLYGSKNFIGDTPDSHILEMSALANDCRRSKDPIVHYVLSWRKGEKPSHAQVHEAAEMFAAGLGMQNHQYVYALHSDTEIDHLHFIVNRVDPITERATEINNGWDIEAAHSILFEIEQKQGWKPTKNAVYRVEDGKKVRGNARENRGKNDTPALPPNIVKNENLTGERSALRRAQEIAPGVIDKATSWTVLHAALAAKGMRYKKSGSGAKIFFNDVELKASSVNRKLSLKTLEKSLGAYEAAAPGLSVEKQERKPLKPFDGEFVQYRNEREKYMREKDVAWANQMAEQSDRKSALIAKQARDRNKALKGNWRGCGDKKNMLRATISELHKKQRVELQETFDAEKKELDERYPTYPNIDEWRKRMGIPAQVYELECKPGNTYVIPIFVVVDREKFRSEGTKNGIVYRHANSGVIAFVDKHSHISVYDHGDEQAVLEALKIAQGRFRSVVVNGNDEFKMTVARIAVCHDIKIASLDVLEMMERFKPEIRNELPAPIFVDVPLLEPEPESVFEVWLIYSNETDIDKIQYPIDVTQMMLDKGSLSPELLRKLACDYLMEIECKSIEYINDRTLDWVESGDIDEERSLATKYIVHMIEAQRSVIVEENPEGEQQLETNTKHSYRKKDDDGIEPR